MEEFLKQYSNIPIEFIKDFYNISKEEYNDNEKIISFDNVVKWLNVRHENLKRLLISKFEKDYDYSIEKINLQKKGGGTYTYKILLTPDCFKELCMISQTERAKEVRKYFLILEKLIRKYKDDINEKIKKELGIVQFNQKPKIKIKGAYIYIIEAQNNISAEKLYKIGKTINLNNRMKTYNTGNANDAERLFTLKVDDIDTVENCIKNIVKKHQYRKYKEVYQINIDILKDIIVSCDYFTKCMIEKLKDEKKPTKNISRMQKNKNKNNFFIYIKYDDKLDT
jgi:phage anti-repressor protein